MDFGCKIRCDNKKNIKIGIRKSNNEKEKNQQK